MAESTQLKGYSCEFVDQVPEDFLCNACNRVARKLTVTECCGESYCYTCIKDTQLEGKPCPKCGTEKFNIYRQPKCQRKIETLQVYCHMKEKGCEWSGPLEQLDTHLDPDQDNCQYMNTKCPLNCHRDIPKNKLKQHVCEECTKRPYVCQHCNFKATYEEVVNTHLPECKYVPLDCPNRCGVTCDREDMEDHMKMCRLEEINCRFCEIGCGAVFKREAEEEHAERNIQHHLMLSTALTTRTKEELQQRIMDLEKKLNHQEQKIEILMKSHTIEKKSFEKKLVLQERRFMKLFKEVFKCSEKNWSFIMSNFKSVIANHHFWKSPIMYTSIGGYKFFVGIICSVDWCHIPNTHSHRRIPPDSSSSNYFGSSAAYFVSSLFGSFASTSKANPSTATNSAGSTTGNTSSTYSTGPSDCTSSTETGSNTDPTHSTGTGLSDTGSTGTGSSGIDSIGTDSTGTGSTGTGSTGTGSTGNTSDDTSSSRNTNGTKSIPKRSTFAAPPLPEYLYASIQVIQGQHDEELRWPVNVTCTIEIVNPRTGQSQNCIADMKWTKPHLLYEEVITVSNPKQLIKVSLLEEFSCYDSLYFRITNLTII